jgi:hypothetical protein
VIIRKNRNVYKVLVGKTEGKRPLGRLHHTLKSIKMHIKQTGWEGMNWIHLTQGRRRKAGCSEHSQEPLGPVRHSSFWTT